MQPGAPPPTVTSGTTLRFVSLVTAVLGTAALIFQSLYFFAPLGNAIPGVALYTQCNERFSHAPGLDEFDFDAYLAAADQARREFVGCVGPFQRTQGWWVLGAVTLLIGVAVVLYLLTPWWIGRRLVPVTPAAFPRLHAVLTSLDERATFLLDPSALRPGGQAFGRLGRYAVRLNAGLVPLSVTDPPMFEAIVRHELAHIRNRDVDIAYAVMALWRAFLAVALVPMLVNVAIVLFQPETRAWSLGLGLRAPIFLAVVYLCRNAVLRSREIRRRRVARHEPRRTERRRPAEPVRRASATSGSVAGDQRSGAVAAARLRRDGRRRPVGLWLRSGGICGSSRLWWAASTASASTIRPASASISGAGRASSC